MSEGKVVFMDENDDPFIVPDPCTVHMFREKPTAHLAGRIFTECVGWNVEVPSDVMEFVAKEMSKVVEKYELEHPDWAFSRIGKTAFQIFSCPKIEADLKKAKENGETQASVFRRWADQCGFEDTMGTGIDEGVVTNPAWKLLRKRYKNHMKKQVVNSG